MCWLGEGLHRLLQAHPNSSPFVTFPLTYSGPFGAWRALSGEESGTVQWVWRECGRQHPENHWHHLCTVKIRVYGLCLFSPRFPHCGAYIFICGNKSQWQLMWPSGVGSNNHCGQCSLENNHNNKQQKGRQLFEGG